MFKLYLLIYVTLVWPSVTPLNMTKTDNSTLLDVTTTDAGTDIISVTLKEDDSLLLDVEIKPTEKDSYIEPAVEDEKDKKATISVTESNTVAEKDTELSVGANTTLLAEKEETESKIITPIESETETTTTFILKSTDEDSTTITSEITTDPEMDTELTEGGNTTLLAEKDSYIKSSEKDMENKTITTPVTETEIVTTSTLSSETETVPEIDTELAIGPNATLLVEKDEKNITSTPIEIETVPTSIPKSTDEDNTTPFSETDVDLTFGPNITLLAEKGEKDSTTTPTDIEMETVTTFVPKLRGDIITLSPEEEKVATETVAFTEVSELTVATEKFTESSIEDSLIISNKTKGVMLCVPVAGGEKYNCSTKTDDELIIPVLSANVSTATILANTDGDWELTTTVAPTTKEKPPPSPPNPKKPERPTEPNNNSRGDKRKLSGYSLKGVIATILVPIIMTICMLLYIYWRCKRQGSYTVNDSEEDLECGQEESKV